jgi:hypothetical protein
MKNYLDLLSKFEATTGNRQELESKLKQSKIVLLSEALAFCKNLTKNLAITLGTIVEIAVSEGASEVAKQINNQNAISLSLKTFETLLNDIEPLFPNLTDEFEIFKKMLEAMQNPSSETTNALLWQPLLEALQLLNNEIQKTITKDIKSLNPDGPIPTSDTAYSVIIRPVDAVYDPQGDTNKTKVLSLLVFKQFAATLWGNVYKIEPSAKEVVFDETMLAIKKYSDSLTDPKMKVLANSCQSIFGLIASSITDKIDDFTIEEAFFHLNSALKKTIAQADPTGSITTQLEEDGWVNKELVEYESGRHIAILDTTCSSMWNSMVKWFSQCCKSKCCSKPNADKTHDDDCCPKSSCCKDAHKSVDSDAHLPPHESTETADYAVVPTGEDAHAHNSI